MKHQQILALFTWSVMTCLLSSSLHAQWTNRYNGQGDFSDVFNAIAIHSDGSVYLAGYTVTMDESRDALLVKLNAAGDTLWTRTYNGIGSGPDEILDIKLDNSGHAYVTGYQRGAGSGSDFYTAKYSSDGDSIWMASYNYTANAFDQSNALVLDASGNIYITGQSDSDASPENNDDYVIIKYNNSGLQEWAKRFNGSGNGIDRPEAIALSSDGGVVITGRSDNGADDDYLTIKYNGSGLLQWTKYFDRTHNDRATGMVVDPVGGKIFITGRSSNGTNYDYATVCYNNGGSLQWSAIYDYVDDDRAIGIGMDGSGNIYVTGQSDANATAVLNYDITTVKYNASGLQQWIKTYSGAAGGDDIPSGIYVDSEGTIQVTGYSDSETDAVISNDVITLQYNTSGTLQWNTSYSFSAGSNDVPLCMAANDAGQLWLAGYQETIPNKDAVAIRLNADGIQDKEYIYQGIGDNADNVHFITSDQSNNIYLAGYTVGYESDRNYMVMKLNPLGEFQWNIEINGSSTLSTDDAQALAIDATGNIYVTGYTKNKGTGSDYTTMKLTASGDSVWVRHYNDILSNESDRAYGIGLDDAGNIYVTGKSDSDPSVMSNDDVITIRYSSGGDLDWIQRYAGIAGGDDEARKMIVKEDGTVYVAGKTFNGTDMDLLLIKYNAAGVQQWVKTYDGGSGDDAALSLVMDATGNICVTGYTSKLISDMQDVLTLCYDPSGALQWEAIFAGDGHGMDEGKSLAAGSDGIVYVGATIDADDNAATLNGDMLLLAYSNEGALLWSDVSDPSLGGNEDGSEVHVDEAGNIYFTGQTDQGDGVTLNYDYLTLQYGADGSLIQSDDYNGTGNGNDVPNTMTTIGESWCTTGGSTGVDSQRDIVTILYGSTPLSIQSNMDKEVTPVLFPNPFNELAQLDLSETEFDFGQAITIRIMNLTGQVVYELISSNNQLITIHGEDLPEGMYLLTAAQSGSATKNIKIIIQ